MALQFGQRIIFLLLFCFASALHAQTVYYPAQSSDQLRLTAEDVATLFNKAIPESNFSAQPYTSIPQSGIVFIYDSAFINNQSCKIESDGNRIIKFSAAQDAGLCFGIYDYLNELGFRFYLPGTLWEKIPKLNTPYKFENKIVSQKFKYNNWFISGGYNRWIMDMTDPYGGNFGKNGHDWSQYQLRNNMNGAYRFSGHRGDIFNSEYLSTLQANPCYIACNNGVRKANSAAVPDINNNNAKEYWASTILQNYTSYKKNILSAPVLYKNFYHNFNYVNENIGIEVPDGSAWGNSLDNLGCVVGNYYGNPYPKESDQQFLLANFTASKINYLFSEKIFQCYAYSNHADVPSSEISINKKIDVQVVASAFQSETSPAGLLNRWYKKHSNISEYDYMNIPQWTGETPLFSFNNYKNSLARLKQMNSQGIVIEASPAKFASLPFLFAGNRYLQYNISIDSSLNEFTFNMFPQQIAVHINQLLKYWGDDNVLNGGPFINDNKYKIPLFLQELNKAINASQNTSAEVIERLQQLKAYLHYIVLYYDYISDKRAPQNKSEKAAKLCLYLAKTNKLQLVNSYFLILDIVNKFPATSIFYKQYNITDGSAYNNGNLPSINDVEINNNFSQDILKYAASVTDYKFENAIEIIGRMNAAGLKSVSKIQVGIGYTNGYDYPNNSEFYFYAPLAGAVNINCVPEFGMSGKGFINFTVEAIDKPLLVIKDETISRENNPGDLKVIIPSAGLYKLSIVSKYKSYANLTITTNGNIFFKRVFYGPRVENYRDDNWKNLPKYFYVPQISQLYFSINNACYTNSCLTPYGVEAAFGIKNNKGNNPQIEVSPFDSSLYKISISDSTASSFWKVTQMREYNFCFANISNIEIFAEPKPKLEAASPSLLPDGSMVYPNPSSGIFNFKKNNSALILNNINVFDLQGKKIAEATNAGSINLSAFPSGIYFYSAQKENEIIKGKLIKN
ncbi:MAG: T9SS type A sorting domain-containing protein [Bacteroidota bacterium]|nr:T9SS type A sorting domain-containing protein [Bacteroidota bacterium]